MVLDKALLFPEDKKASKTNDNPYDPQRLCCRDISQVGQFICPEVFHENANQRVQDDIEKEELPIHFPFFSHFPEDPEDDQVENHFIELGRVKGLSREHLSCRAVRRVDHAPRQAGRIAMGVSVEKAAHSADSLPQYEGWRHGVGKF